MTNEPTYLVQTEDDHMHTYWSRDILLCDLAINKDEPVRIYQRRVGMGGLKVSYAPITREELQSGARDE